MYDPLIHKTPYGAAVAGMPISIKFPLDKALHAKRCFIVFRQIFAEDTPLCEHMRVEIPFVECDNDEDVFAVTLTLKGAGVYMYRFEAELENGELAFFGRGYDGVALRRDWLPEWQLTVSKRAYKTPNWAKHGVTYQIFADRFCKVGDNEFVKKGRLHTYWSDTPDIAEEGKDFRADDFFGGNIRGILSRLDYLKSLGVTLIYLTPIFKSPSNHRYDTSDYLAIDELFGSEEEFAQLIKAADALGIKIMLDGVFNHTGADSIYFNKYGNFDSLGAYQSEQSQYFEWYKFSDFPTKYDCWWGSTVVPTVNKSAPGYSKLVLGEGGVIDKWTKLGVKGWRFDVVDELPVEFTTELCACVKSKGEDMLIIGEVWEDASTKVAYDVWRPYFMGEQLDGVMNYPFRQAILDLAKGGDPRDFREKVTRILENYPRESLNVLLNLIGSHDTVRAITELSGVTPPDSKLARANFSLNDSQYEVARARLMFAAALQYSLPGVPCVYYGDEAGLQGFEDPLNRGTYPWGREDKTLLAYYKDLGRLRTKFADVLTGKTFFENDDKLVIFDRVSGDAVLTVLANPSQTAVTHAISGVDAMSGRRIKRAVTVPPLGVRFVVCERNK